MATGSFGKLTCAADPRIFQFALKSFFNMQQLRSLPAYSVCAAPFRNLRSTYWVEEDSS